MGRHKKIEKLWVVYGWFLGPWGIGKIVESSKNSCHINYSEKQIYPPELWDLKWIQRFNISLEAIDYFWEHNPDLDYYYSKAKVIEMFLSDFPSEKKNLEKILALREPK